VIARIEGVRLGTRWVVRARGRAAGLVALQVAALALAAMVGLVAVCLWAGNQDRAERGRAQEPRSAFGQDPAFRVSKTDAQYAGDVWSTVFVSDDRGDAAAPPGLSAFPEPGQTWVSPAVAHALEQDPAARQRITGTVVGVIGELGLQSPDQYFVYSGLTHDQNQDAWNAGGWGSPADTSERPSIPSGPFLAILGALVGLPVLLMVRASAQLSEEARTRELVTLHLLGVPVRLLATAAATRTLVTAALGCLVGSILACAVVLTVSADATLGISWFRPSTILPWAPTTLIVLAVCLTTTLSTYRRTRRALRAVETARSGEPRGRPALVALPMALGIALLAGIVIPHLLLGAKLSSGTTYNYFLAGTSLAVLGSLACLGMILRGVGKAMCRRGPGVLRLLGGRRLWWDSNVIARSVAAIMIVITCGMIGAAAISDLEHLSTTSAIGDQYTVSLTDTQSGRAVLDVPVAVSVLSARTSRHRLWVGTCEDLAAVASATSPSVGTAFANVCGDGERFEVDDRHLPGISQTDLDEGRFWSVPPSSYRGQLRHGELLAYPGEDHVDDYLSAAIGADPTLSVTNTSADSYAPMIPPTRRVFLIGMAGGVLVATALLIVTTIDGVQRSRLPGARLVVLGASRQLTAQVVAIAVGTAAVAITVVSLVIGWLCGMTYDIAGGTGATPGGLGLSVTAWGAAFAAITVVAAWLVSRRGAGSEIVELMHRE